MHILDLPPEVFHQIMLFMILGRSIPLYSGYMDVRRALILKLVSKVFYHAFQPALFESRVLDKSTCGGYTFLWSLRESPPCKLWHSYTLYRVRNETNPNVGHFVEIQETARQMCSLTQDDYDKVTERLCWLLIYRTMGRFRCIICRTGRERRIQHPSTQYNMRLNLLSAAAYFGHVDLAKQLLDEGCCPADYGLFYSPIHIAALYGKKDVLILFQEHLPDYQDQSSNNELSRWTGKTDPHAICAAAVGGDMDIVRLAIFPPSRKSPQRYDFNGHEFGNVDPRSNSGDALIRGLSQTANWDVFQYIEGGLSPFFSRENKYMHRNARRGNLRMVEKLIDHGWPAEGEGLVGDCPLVAAARGGHLDVVELLLSRGANPNNYNASKLGSPLQAAATAGSMSIIRKLYEYGANTDDDPEDQEGMLCKALQLEHTEMVNFFFERGLLSRVCPSWIREVVEMDGLESMLELLKRWG